MLHDGKFYIKLGLPSGNAFPTVPAPEEGDVFYREDLDRVFVYDGANWQLIPLNNPCARAFHGVAQGIAHATLTTLAFNSERFDTDAIHDNAVNNSRLTCQTAGKYQITVNLTFVANGVGERAVYLRVNGVTYIAGSVNMPTPTFTQWFSATTLYDLAATDFVEVQIYQSSGGALDVTAEFMMVRVG